MIRIDIPQRGMIELQHAVFDVNGTLGADGMPFPGVVDRLKALADLLSLHALTAGTHGNLPQLEQALGLPLRIIGTGDEIRCTTILRGWPRSYQHKALGAYHDAETR